MLIPGDGDRLRLVPGGGLAGGGVEFEAGAGGADQLGPVAVGQRPGEERPGPDPSGGTPPHLERPASTWAAPHRVDAHIEPGHRRLLSPWRDRLRLAEAGPVSVIEHQGHQ
jgi:hypothetical protein